MAQQSATQLGKVMQSGSSCVYVSNAEDGDIGIWRLEADGTMIAAGRAALGTIVGPLVVSPDGRFLYAATRAPPCTVHAFTIEPASGALHPLAVSPLAESFPYVSLDTTGRYLFGASYGASMISVNRIGDDGRVAANPLQVVAVARNAHSIRIDATNRYVYVPALGADTLNQFRFDAVTGRLSPNSPPSVSVEAGSGPRHFAFARDNRFLYLLNEMRGTVTVFALDGDTGLARLVHSVSSVPPDSDLIPGLPRGPAAPPLAPARDSSRDIWAAEIHLTPDGRFLYTSERTSSTLSLLRVDTATGALAYAGSTPTEKQPRGFAIDPTGKFLVACGEKSQTVSVYAIDGGTGALRLLQKFPGGKGANWVSIVGLQ